MNFRLIWGSWKWTQMISHDHKHWVWYKKQLSIMSRTKVSISILEVILGFLQPRHHVLALHVDLNVMEVIPNNFPKNRDIIDTKNESLLCSETNLKSHSLKSSLTSYNQCTLFLTFRLIWSSWKWSQMILHIKRHWFWHQNQVCSMFSIPNFKFHPLKLFLASCSPSTLFLAHMTICGFWKWSQMISNPHKPGVWHQNQVSSIFRSKVMK